MTWLQQVVRQRVGGERGQAAIEYAVSTFYLAAVGLAAAPAVMHFMPDMMNALQIYLDGFYFVFSLPIP